MKHQHNWYCLRRAIETPAKWLGIVQPDVTEAKERHAQKKRSNKSRYAMRTLIASAFALGWLTVPVSAETFLCEGTNVSVHPHQSAYADMTCEAVKRAEAVFDQCNLPPFSDPIRIEFVSELEPGCVALYHCGEHWIEVLEPPLMDTRRSSEGAFAFLAIEDYFQSVIVHELAHTTFDDVPCPFEACITANEYVAYAMQVMSLTPGAQTEFAANSELDRRVSRDELSLILLFMAPGRFAQKAWAHLSQRDDPCAFVGHIMDGTALLDRERF